MSVWVFIVMLVHVYAITFIFEGMYIIRIQGGGDSVMILKFCVSYFITFLCSLLYLFINLYSNRHQLIYIACNIVDNSYGLLIILGILTMNFNTGVSSILSF